MGHLSEILFGNKSFEMTGFPCQNIEPLEWDTPSLAAIQKEASVNGLGHPSRKSQTELAHQMWPTLKKFGPVGPLHWLFGKHRHHLNEIFACRKQVVNGTSLCGHIPATLFGTCL